MENLVGYFEIPVLDLDRAMAFYGKVFDCKLEHQIIDGYEMASFPFNEKLGGISGALAKGEVYQPTTKGCLIYFSVEDISNALKIACEAGGRVLYECKSIGDLGFVAEFADTEGNRIALHQSL